MGEEITTGMPIDLLLVRHGHSEGNRALESAEDGDVRLHQDRRYRARSAADYRLTAEGRAQAATAGAWLRSWLDDEGLDAWSVPEVWVMAHPSLTHYVDITATFPRKVAALHAHESQTAHMEDLEGFIRGWAQRAGSVAGFDEGHLAEGFFVVSIPV